MSHLEPCLVVVFVELSVARGGGSNPVALVINGFSAAAIAIEALPVLAVAASSSRLFKLIARQRPTLKALLEALQQAHLSWMVTPVLRGPEREAALGLTSERRPNRARVKAKQSKIDRQRRVAVRRQREVIVSLGEMPVLISARASALSERATVNQTENGPVGHRDRARTCSRG